MSASELSIFQILLAITLEVNAIVNIGKIVSILKGKNLTKGKHLIEHDCSTFKGGVYLCKIQIGNNPAQLTKLILAK